MQRRKATEGHLKSGNITLLSKSQFLADAPRGFQDAVVGSSGPSSGVCHMDPRLLVNPTKLSMPRQFRLNTASSSAPIQFHFHFCQPRLCKAFISSSAKRHELTLWAIHQSHLLIKEQTSEVVSVKDARSASMERTLK